MDPADPPDNPQGRGTSATPPRLSAEEERALLDELGDVFLSDAAPAPPAESGPIPRHGDDHAEPDADDDHPLAGPAPIRLRPKLPPERIDRRRARREADEEFRAFSRPNPDTAATTPHAAAERSEAGGRALHDATPTPTDPTAPPPADPDPSMTDATLTADPAAADLEPQTEPDAPPQALAELVLLGNLPGMAGPWLTQYAQLIAEAEGPVALVHVDDEAIEVELVEPSDATLTEAATTTRMIAGAEGTLDAVAVLDALLEREHEPVRNVLLHAEASDDPRVVAGFAKLPTWTLLTGGDDAAIVAGYGMLKRLAEADASGKGDDAEPREVGLMVMGSDEQAARTAADRLAQTAGHGLPYRVELTGTHRRMAPVRVRPLCEFTAMPHARVRLMAWLASLEPPVTRGFEQAGREPRAFSAGAAPEEEAIDVEPSWEERDQPPRDAAAEPVEPAPRSRLALDMDWPRPRGAEPARSARPAMPSAVKPVLRVEPPPPKAPPEPAAEPAMPEAVHQPDREAVPSTATVAAGGVAAGTETRRAVSAEPGPEPGVEEAVLPVAPAPDSHPELERRDAEDAGDRVEAPSLAELLIRPGGVLADAVALDARCPDHADSELVLDEAGVLHVLARHDSESDAADPDAALLRLMQTRRWAAKHHELLALTRRQLRFAPDAEPRLHLFTDRADLATKLVANLDGDVSLHLLQEIEIGDETGWYSTPLG